MTQSGTKHNVAKQRIMSWQKEQKCCRTNHKYYAMMYNSTAQHATLQHEEQQHIRKHNAMEQGTIPWHDMQCCSTYNPNANDSQVD